MYKEEDGSYFISVKHFCSFLNFNTLKTSLEAIPENNDVIIDFSLCGFVDHSSMENIDDYQELFHKKGGNIEVIGLDVLGAESKHPFALRRMLPVQKMMPDNKTKRQKNLGIISDKFELSYEYEKKYNNFYKLLIEKLMQFEKDHKYTYHYTIWDHMRIMDSFQER